MLDFTSIIIIHTYFYSPSFPAPELPEFQPPASSRSIAPD